MDQRFLCIPPFTAALKRDVGCMPAVLDVNIGHE